MRTPALASVALLAAALYAGCASAPPKPAGEPALLQQALQVASQDLTQVALRLQGELAHPGAATLEAAAWELVADGQVVQRGESALGTALTPGIPTPFAFEVKRPYVQDAEALRTLSGKQGSLLIALRGTLRVNAGGRIQGVPFAASRPVRTPRLPRVRVERLDAARYGPEEVTLTVGLGVDNPNPFPVRLSGLSWALGVKGKALAEGNALRRDGVGPASTGVYDVEASITRDTWGEDVGTLLRAGTLPYSLKGTLEGEGFSIPYALEGDVKLAGSR
jgi:LEA14-like dessication related protein